MVCDNIRLEYGNVQVMHNLSVWTAVEKELTYDQLAAAADNAKKDLHVVSFLYHLYLCITYGVAIATCYYV